MNINDSTLIDVLNYRTNYVYARGSAKNWEFPPAISDSRPSKTPVPFAEIRYISSQTNGFYDGVLFFSPEIQETVYKILGITDWENILTLEKIKDIILHPTISGLQRLIDIEKPAQFDTVREVLFKLKSDDYDVSSKVDKVISERYYELSNKIRKSNIKLTPKDADTRKGYNELKEENKSMRQELDELKKAMAELMSSQKNSTAQAQKKRTTPASAKKQTNNESTS